MARPGNGRRVATALAVVQTSSRRLALGKVRATYSVNGDEAFLTVYRATEVSGAHAQYTVDREARGGRAAMRKTLDRVIDGHGL